MKRIYLLIFLCIFILQANAQQDGNLKFNKNHTFRIVQITDVHHKINNEDASTALIGLAKILDRTTPDMVFFTGDIVVDKNMQKGWDEVLQIVIDRKIPWAVVFGNHDDEQGSTRQQIMSYIIEKPYCYAQFGPKNIKGIGNYVLKIENSENSETAALLYAFDSHAYSNNIENEKYGYFDFSQVTWYRNESKKFTENNHGNPYPALAFFHIPLREYAWLNDSTKYTRFGTRLENECHGALNTGMYAAMYEAGDVMGTFVGHDHVNDYIGKLNTICLAYGRFSGSKTTYGSLTNGVRVIELTERKKEFKSWIVTTKHEIVNRVVFNGKTLKHTTD